MGLLLLICIVLPCMILFWIWLLDSDFVAFLCGVDTIFLSYFVVTIVFVLGLEFCNFCSFLGCCFVRCVCGGISGS